MTWKKEGYELLKAVGLLDYYYVMPGAESKESEDYFYYSDLIVKNGEFCHVIYYVEEGKRTKYLLEDAMGEIRE